jgi:HlyD family secretion protein
LVAPFSGTVASVDIDPGEFAAPGATVVRLADTSNWQIETTDLTELNVANVREGMPVTLTFDAVPELQLSGKVTKIKPYGENKQGDIVYTVIVTPDQQDARLRWNMTAKVTIGGG